ncbi:hypothetical protein Daus18300_012114 [Diaporthe australafricana]|uniref:Heterokaryon incompatibility domain-containing protein n=1 Tax=Diaporthe australafricana TaxID=127596 RepID=A0ABR3W3W9_9PEZI
MEDGNGPASSARRLFSTPGFISSVRVPGISARPDPRHRDRTLPNSSTDEAPRSQSSLPGRLPRVAFPNVLPQLPNLPNLRRLLPGSNKLCSRCSKINFAQFGHEPGSSRTGGQGSTHILDLKSILARHGAQRSKEPTPPPPYHVSFSTWASERTRPLTDSEAKWPFGYTYDNVGIVESREAQSDQQRADNSDALDLDFKEGHALNDRPTAQTLRHLSVSGLATAGRVDDNAERNKWYHWATKIIPDSIFLDTIFKNKSPAALKLIIYGQQHEKSGIIEIKLWGAPKARGRAILLLSRFNLRIASPSLTPKQDLQLRYGKVVDNAEIDLDLCHSWLNHCRNTHGETCNTPSWASRLQKPYGLAFRLIDVKNKCLTETDPTTCDFAALSYVWGEKEEGKKLLHLNDSTITRFFTPNKVNSDVGKTIWDAIAVAQSLDIRYLWADRLCINQDDENDQAAQIGQMDRIYGNAVVTIVAATSKDLSAGIRGITTPRSVDQLASEVCSAPVVNVVVPIQSEIDRSPWAGRAWTFQEKLLSKRLLIFHHGMVEFYCRCGVMREDMTARDAGVVPPAIGWLSLASGEISSSMKPQSYAGQPPRLLRSPVFVEYAGLIEQYTPRRMTEGSDAVPAILSLLKILIQSEQGKARLLHGLVEEFFDQALHWQPASEENVRLQLRDRDGTPRSGFPTWSWAAWEPVGEHPGGARYEVPFQVHTDDKGALKKVILDDASEEREERIRPLLRWYVAGNRALVSIPSSSSDTGIKKSTVPPPMRSKSSLGIGKIPVPPPTRPPKPIRLRSSPATIPKPAMLHSQPTTTGLRPLNGTGLGVAFGTRADHASWDKFARQNTHNLDQSAPMVSDLQLSSGCLVFKTRSAEFRLGQTRSRVETLWRRNDNAPDASSGLTAHSTLHIRETAVLNENRREVGRVMLPDPDDPKLNRQPDHLHDFIMLSEAQYFGDEDNVEVGDHPLLNIMMIKWDENRTLATRRAMGKMKKKDWWSAPGREETVVLK